MIPESMNGLRVELSGKNAIIIHAEDVEGSDKVVELNRALHVIKVLRGNIEHAIAQGTTNIINWRYWVQSASGSLMSVSETKQAITFIQPYSRFSGEQPPWVDA